MAEQDKTIFVVRYPNRWLVKLPEDHRFRSCSPLSEKEWMITVKKLLQEGYNVIELNPREGIIRIPS